MVDVRFALSSEAWLGLSGQLRRIVSLDRKIRRVCEVGGGANPALHLEQVQELGIDYTVLDISEAELAKAPEGFHRLRADICHADLQIANEFDFVFSRMLAEHVPDPRAFHANIHRILRPGGRAFHFFPTLYSPVFVVNRCLPGWLTEPILLALQPIRRREGRHGKFPAYYRWCVGPCRRQLRRFQSVGFEVEEYWGFFGHSGNCTSGPGYYNRVPVARILHERLSRILVHRPQSWATSYAYVLLRKPEHIEASRTIRAA